MPHRNQTSFDEGWMAWTDGALISENPYAYGGSKSLPYPAQAHDDYKAWHDGWCAACEDSEHQESERDDYGDRIDFEYDRRRG